MQYYLAGCMQSYTLSRAPQLSCPLAVMHNRGVFVNAKGDVSRATFGCAPNSNREWHHLHLMVMVTKQWAAMISSIVHVPIGCLQTCVGQR